MRLEDREQPPFDLRTARHGSVTERKGSTRGKALESTGDARRSRRPRAAFQDEVIAGALAFGAGHALQTPHQRMEQNVPTAAFVINVSAVQPFDMGQLCAAGRPGRSTGNREAAGRRRIGFITPQTTGTLYSRTEEGVPHARGGDDREQIELAQGLIVGDLDALAATIATRLRRPPSAAAVRSRLAKTAMNMNPNQLPFTVSRNGRRH